ncbi:MAG TPA: PhnD/SsuA/transferrin family substrate-binding protein [Anaerolineales bacterium]
MKRLFLLLLVGIYGCGLRNNPYLAASPTPPSATVTPTIQPTATIPAAALGNVQNPLILALAPAPRLDPNALNASKILIAHLEKSTGYQFITVSPTSESDLIQRFQNGNAHIGVLSPFGYLLASKDGSVDAAFARQQNGSAFYGAQFIVRSDAGFLPYFDPLKNQNTADASTALAQFQNKKPCWADPLSPSGFVVPLGFLAAAGVQTADPAFVAGQPTVVRAVYAQGICDFGATYVDARTYPGLADAFPDVMKQVIVVWRTPDIIPYETLAFTSAMDNDMRRILLRAFADAMNTPDGSSAMQTLYGMDAMQVSQDGQYQDFRKAVNASGLDLNILVK